MGSGNVEVAGTASALTVARDDPSSGLHADETVLEYAVRSRLGRTEIKELLERLGEPTSGGRDETAERLLGTPGLKLKDVLDRLELDDLKVVQRRFDVPAPKPSGFGIFTNEKKDLVEAISKAAARDRYPAPKGASHAAASIPGPLAIAATSPPLVRESRARCGVAGHLTG